MTDGWSARFEVMHEAWQSVLDEETCGDALASTQKVARWTASATSMKAEQFLLTSQGRWRGGPRTLVAALGRQWSELDIVAGLAWVLRPDGHHGAGDGPVRTLCEHLGLPWVDDSRVRIVTEETRHDADGSRTRADLVIYGPTWTIVVEAKVAALEQADQLLRLQTLWANEPSPVFVFLTPGGSLPTSAGNSRESWRVVAWSQIAIWLRPIGTIPTISAGMIDYLETLEHYYVRTGR